MQLRSTKYKLHFVSDQNISEKERTFMAKARIWLYPTAAAWNFVTVPPKVSKAIRRRFNHLARGWGSLPVEVRLGDSKWNTSIFPDKKRGAYLLPIKAMIRKQENVRKGDQIVFTLRISV